jgi:hypothetical protein
MKSNKEIVVTPLQIVIGLLLALGLALAGFSLVPQIAKLPLFAGTTPVGLTSEAAARAGAEVFFSVDAKVGRETWTSQVCALSTPNGCEMTRKVYAPMLWPSIEKLGLRLVCKVTSAELAQDLSQANAPAAQAWKVTSSCTKLDTGETSGGAAKIFVAETAGAGWLLERIGFDQEPN